MIQVALFISNNVKIPITGIFQTQISHEVLMQKETIIFSLSTFSSTYVNLLKIFFPFYSILTCDDDNKLANKEARLKILVTTISLKHSPTLLLIKLTTSSTEEFLFSASVLLLIS